MRLAVQILAGLTFCIIIAYVLAYSGMPFFWEHEEPLQPYVETITWRSGVALVLLLAITQAISFALFRWWKLSRSVE